MGEAMAEEDTAKLCHIAERAMAMSAPEAAPSSRSAAVMALGTITNSTIVMPSPPTNAVPTVVMAWARRLQYRPK